MSIRVVCTSCHSASEVPDEARGEQATCPHCSEVFNVPALATVSDAEEKATAESNSGVPDTQGSLHLPVGAKQVEIKQPPLPKAPPFEWGQIEPRVCFQLAVELYKAHAMRLLSAHCLFLGTMFGSTWLLQSLTASGSTTAAAVLQFPVMALILYLNIGVSLLGLSVARNKPPEKDFAFSGGDKFLRILGFNLLFTLVVFIGCVGFIVPGLYIASRFWAGSWFILDQDCTIPEAFGLAGQLSDGNRLPSMMLGIMTLCLAICGAALLGVGLVLVYPLITMLWAVAYLMLTRQPIEVPGNIQLAERT